MNSSPPPPSFTLPPLTSKGKLPVTPSPTPSPHEGTFDFRIKASKGKGKERAQDVSEVEEDVGRVSMYVRSFEEMIETVSGSESYLFSPREIWILKHIIDLAYEPKYSLTRLLLRLPGKIHSYSDLVTRYSPELGEEGVLKAARKLAQPLPVPEEIRKTDPERPRTTSPQQPAKLFLTPQSNPRPHGKRKPWASLATGSTEEEEKADPDSAEAIRESLWASQVGLIEVDDEGSVVKSASPSEPPSGRSTPTTPTDESKSAMYSEKFSLTPQEPDPIDQFAKTQDEMSLDGLMSCIPADESRKLARARKVPASSLINRDAVTKASKRIASEQTTLAFTPVGKGKSKMGDTFPKQATSPFTPSKAPKASTSEALLVASLSPILGGGALQSTSELHALVARVNLLFSRTPPLTATSSSLMLPSILVTSHKRRYPDYGTPTRSRIWKDRKESLTWERVVYWEGLVADALGDTWAEQRKNPVPGFGIKRDMLSRTDGAKVVKRIWEGIWPAWRESVEGDKGQEVDVRQEEGGLVGDRFQIGHVLTRIVYKGATALGISHEYDMECEVLAALLAQRRWRRGRRGAWYDRLASVLMNHYNASPEEKESKSRAATQVCIDASSDEDTHSIYRPGLSRRLTRSENKLDLPADERHISYASLSEAFVRRSLAPRVPDNMGTPRFRRETSAKEREASMGLGDEGLEMPAAWQQTGKSVWVGRDSEVTVEGWVLEWWEDQGYKGYHAESSILTTLFALIMWPVLFHPSPGVFETPYQTAPLDLGEDTFAPARADIFEARLEAICKTKTALEYSRETDERERDRGTWAVGLNWEYGREDLEELVQCSGGQALSGICRMLGEEYRHRASGVPDLIVWNFEKREARFVEVKGPGDNLSETQRVWIDVLLSAGVPVEVCRVIADDPKKSLKALEKLKKRQDIAARLERVATGKAKREDTGAWSGPEDEDTEGEEDEWKYESGDEGKGEGKWENGNAPKRRRVTK